MENSHTPIGGGKTVARRQVGGGAARGARDPGRLAARDACARGPVGGDVGKIAGGTAIA